MAWGGSLQAPWGSGCVCLEPEPEERALDQLASVAPKSCKCGYALIAAGAQPVREDALRRTRTGRVQRATKFFDMQDYKLKRRSQIRVRSRSRSTDGEYKKEKIESATARARRRRALRRAQREAPPSGERSRDPTPQLRPAQLARCSLILEEINRKMLAVTWQPPQQI